MAAPQQQGIGLRIGDNPTRSGDHGSLLSLDDALEASTLVATEGGKSCHLDKVGDLRPIFALDQAVELNKGPAKRLCESSAQRRLAGATQADKRNASGSVAGVIGTGVTINQVRQNGKLGGRQATKHIEDVAQRSAGPVRPRQQFDDRHIEGIGNSLEHGHGRVAQPAFDLRQVTLRCTRPMRQLTASHAALGARQPDEAPDCSAKPFLVETGIVTFAGFDSQGAHAESLPSKLCIIIHAI
jgi:hypothetical protein